MISVGRRDARKEGSLGSGEGGGRREMEETELEEGEACSYNNNEDGYSSGMDPDIDLSYIDEKLQNVLGHLQKDFEGGVSAENLGAKFGGYGSFLPVCLRSPVWPHPRTPPRAQHHFASRSPNNLHLEGGHRSSVSSTNGAHSGRPETTSTGATWLPESKTPSSFHESAKPEGCFRPTVLSEDPGSKSESVNINSCVSADQKLLKVRIKVGSDNLSANKNAAIYSGLGLDASPSVDDSPSESEGMSNDPHDALESPAHIIQIMTILPVQGGLLLSPLADDLILLTKREKCLKDGSSFPVSRVEPETSKSVSELVRDDRKKVGGKKSKSVDSKGISLAMRDNNKVRSATRDTENEANVDALACEELVSSTLKLPLLSNSHTASGDLGKRTWTSPVSKGSKGVAREKAPSHLKEEPPLIPEDSAVQKCESTLGGKVLRDKEVNPGIDATAGSEEGGQLVEKTGSISVKADKIAHKKRKAQHVDESDNVKQKADRKVPASGQEATKLYSLKHNPEGKKKKVSKKHRNLVADLPKEIQSLDDGSLLVPKNLKRNSADEQASKGELKDLALQKNDGKSRDHYKEFFGDIDLDENQSSLPEMSGDGRLKSFEVEGKTERINSAPKERFSTKEIDKLSKVETYGKAGSQFALQSAAAPVSDVAPTTTAEDNWVCCDKCQQWRLLPLGKNPDDLPEKWLCSMLNWLPGMNRCSFTEAETTNALIALYQVPAPESQTGIQNNLGAFVPRGNLEEFRQRNHSRENMLHGMPVGKKKQSSKDGLPRLSNSMKKGMQVSSGTGSLNEMSQSPLTNEPDVRLSKSGRSSTEKLKSKPKERDKSHQSSSDKDDIKWSKMKVRRDPDQGSATTSKKIRTDGLLEDWSLNHEGSLEKAGLSSSNDLPHTSSLKNIPNRNDLILSKDSSSDIKGNAQVSHKIPRDEQQKSVNDLSTDKRKTDSRDVLKKRKTKERYNPGSLPKAGNDIEDNGILEKEDFSENDYRKEKKVRVSRSDRMDMGAGKGSDTADKISQRKNLLVREELGYITSQQGMDGGNCFRRDPGSVEPFLPATSSSSKVSGSHNTKANCFDAKGSPVESVSSSPLRVLKPEKLILETPNITEKDDAGLIPPGAMTRCSDGEDEGKSDRSGSARKDKSGDVACQGSLESSVDYQEKASSPLSGSKLKVEPICSPNTANNHSTSNGEVKPYLGKVKTLDKCHDEGRQNERPHQSNRPNLTLSGKASSSRSKDMIRNSSSDFDECKEKIPHFVGEQVPEYEVKQTEGRNKVEEPNGIRYDEYVDNNDAAKKFLPENIKRERQPEFTDNNGSDFSIDVNGKREPTFTPRLFSAPDDHRVSERYALSLGAEDEKHDCKGAVPLSQNKNGLDILTVNAPGNVNMPRAKKEVKKVEHSNGIRDNSSCSVMSNGHRTRDHDAPSPAKRDSSNQAATNALKEAKKLKHKADRLKNSGMILESTRLYFEAALKFLHGACLLENCSNESAKNGEMVQSMQMYSSTAKLCEFCAHEYEKSKDLAAAALAYKCMEVAYMRVIYSSNSNASRDRHELQMALQMVPPGESPASSASDIDNLNHSTVDRALLSKSTSSPQVAGSHVIAARNRPNFLRLLNFAQNVNFAMEASRKSRAAFASANVKTGEAQTRDAILCVKTALDFNFHDVEGLLHLVRVAFDSISN